MTISPGAICTCLRATAAELESYRKIVEAALNDVTAKAYALAGADMTRATPPIAKSPVAQSPS